MGILVGVGTEAFHVAEQGKRERRDGAKQRKDGYEAHHERMRLRKPTQLEMLLSG